MTSGRSITHLLTISLSLVFIALPGLAQRSAKLPTTPPDVLTYRGDNLRTGWFSSETRLNLSNVDQTSFGLLNVVPLSPQNQSAVGSKPLPKTEDVHSCSGDVPGSATTVPSSQSHQSSHSVTLSWNPSIPASASPRDAVRGYYVYRSLGSPKFSESDRMNSFPLQGTRCIDRVVAPKTTYYYAVKAVAANSRKSDYSQPVTAIIPSP